MEQMIRKSRKTFLQLDFHLEYLRPVLQLTFAISLFFLINSQFIFSTKKENTKFQIGVIKEIIGSAKIVSYTQREHVWVSLKEGQKIYQNDSIYAEINSRVQIQFTDQQSMWVMPNSMAQMTSYGDNQVVVHQGNAFVNFYAGQRLVMQNGDIIHARKNSQVYFDNLKNKNPSITSGAVEVTDNETGKMKLLVKRKSVAEVGKEIDLKSPKIGKEVKMKKDREVRLSWESKEEDFLWTLEISDSANFETIQFTKGVGQEVQTNMKLPIGKWFWRVRGKRIYTESYYQSTIGQFEIKKPSQLRFPTAVVKKMILRPTHIRFSQLTDPDRTLVQWHYREDSNRFYLKIHCSNKKAWLNILAGQSQAFLELRPYVGCQLKVKSIDENSISKWSLPARIKRSYVE